MTHPRTTGPAYDPQRPRHLTRSQAEEARFYSALGSLTVRGIEAVLNARTTAYECPACGRVTFGEGVDACGACGKRRGSK